MKKFTLLLIVTMICTVAFGQYVQKEAQLRKDVPTIAKYSNQSYAELTKEAIWSNDFSNASDWVMDHATDTEDKDWVICTVETAPAGWITPYGMNEDFVSPTVDNGFALYNSDYGSSSGPPTQDAWIQIANPVDLSSVDAPRFIFSTYYKRWDDLVYFEYSTNGTDWTAIELFPEIVHGGATTPDFINLLNVPELGNVATAYFRFRNVGDWDYGWYIDDISIVDAPNYDLKLMSTATNFFGIIDYHEAGQEQYYHYSSHFGMIPDECLVQPTSYILFNAVVLNNGMQEATPSVDVTITDPASNEVYSFTYTHDVPLNSGELDTLDIAWGDDEFYVMSQEDFMLGNFDITFEAYIDGQTDGAPDNNSYATFFEATDYSYARDGGSLDGVCGPGIWLDGGLDGDMFGVDYTFFESTTIDSVQAYIVSNSTAGTAVICHALQFDSESSTWVSLAQSSLITIEEGDLGTWKTFTFSDPAAIALGGEETSIDIKIALEFYYNGEENVLWIGEDNTIPSSVWGTSWKFAGDEGWTVITNYYNSVPMIRAYIIPTLDNVASNFAQNDINMYPNPSTGIVTISNVEGA
ncbi:MAG: hypothetical protein JXR36_06315, partial [Bacteroidales bacterium]|nr:hypothetical protein [Bacteroidales bacterium]